MLKFIFTVEPNHENICQINETYVELYIPIITAKEEGKRKTGRPKTPALLLFN